MRATVSLDFGLIRRPGWKCSGLMSDKPLQGKVGVVFGVANRRSIAWAIAQAWAGAGARLIFNYQGERVKENVEELAGAFGADTPIYPCDVTKDEEIDGFFDKVREHTERVDMVLHSVAFAPKEALEGRFLHTGRSAFAMAHDISQAKLGLAGVIAGSSFGRSIARSCHKSR